MTTSPNRRRSRPGTLASLLSLASLLILAALASAAPERRVGVLVYDGSQPEQVELRVALEQAAAPYAARAELRRMDASLPEADRFRRAYGVLLRETPCFLVLATAAPGARAERRLRLDPAADPVESVRQVFAALRLPLPRLEPPPPPGPVAAAVPGEPGEPRLLAMAAGAQQLRGRTRELEASGVLVYRLRLPASLRWADLAVEIGGSYLVSAGTHAEGPWLSLIDSQRYFGAGADQLPEPRRAVASIDSLVEATSGPLYVRIHPNGRGTNRLALRRVEVVARARGEHSREGEWLAEVGKLRRERLPATLVDVGARVLAGSLSESVTLRAAESPYVLADDVLVLPGARLTIEPGVTVRIPGNVALRAYGQIVARGTAAQPIVFSPAAPREAGEWKGIQFHPLPSKPSGLGSVLEHCRVVNAAGVDLNGFAGEVAHCLFENALTGIALRAGGSGRVHHNRFFRCRQGLLVEEGAGEVRACEWSGCGTALAVTALHPTQVLRFEGNVVRENRIAAVSYNRPPNGKVPPLLLPGNYWGGVPPGRLVAAGSGEVRFEPALPAAPPEAGPGT